jgi:hypothetical protein
MYDQGNGGYYFRHGTGELKYETRCGSYFISFDLDLR